jgi:serine phosphatase RsbU (regulator of sigma subunit)
MAYALSVANVRRGALERAQRELYAELNAAREVQRMVQPAPRGCVAGFAYAMECRPGLFVAGDLVDLIELGDGRAAICVGDVAGHGMSAALLMSSIQSHLRALLAFSGIDAVSVMTGVNRYLTSTSLEGRFASLWLGIIEPSGQLEFVDAGHGHWMILRPDGSPRANVELPAGIPVGIDPEAAFAAGRVRLGTGEQLVLYSDGLIEQSGAMGDEFGLDRFRTALHDTPTPEAAIAATFAALTRHVGGTTLDDDATVVVVRCPDHTA